MVVIAVVGADAKVQPPKTLSVTQDTSLLIKAEDDTCTPEALSLVSEPKAAKLPGPELF